jgi:hypothetical protein
MAEDGKRRRDRERKPEHGMLKTTQPLWCHAWLTAVVHCSIIPGWPSCDRNKHYEASYISKVPSVEY